MLEMIKEMVEVLNAKTGEKITVRLDKNTEGFVQSKGCKISVNLPKMIHAKLTPQLVRAIISREYKYLLLSRGEEKAV